MPQDEERIALFIDHENLAIGARETGRKFDVGPIMDALAERGRVVARRAYADWTLFAEDRRALTEHNCELIDIPQRTGAVRKNAADIKLAVDAMELAYERGFVSTFVVASGDSDFTPLVAALRALNRRVIGIGVKGSTSALLPPACDEFMFYERLPGVADPRDARGAGGGPRPAASATRQRGAAAGRAAANRDAARDTAKDPAKDTAAAAGAAADGRGTAATTGTAPTSAGAAAGNGKDTDRAAPRSRSTQAPNRDLHELQRTLAQTLAGLKQSGAEPVYASTLKRALLRKDPTFAEGDYGFRAFGEMLRSIERSGYLALGAGQAPGDPTVDFPEHPSGDTFKALRDTVVELQGDEDEVPLSGLKDQIRKRSSSWSEKDFGYSGFLQFAKAAAAADEVQMEWDEEEGDYFLWVQD